MEDFQLDIMVGGWPAARSIKIDLPPFYFWSVRPRVQGFDFTAARDRFGIVQRLEFYQVADLSQIVARSGSLLGLNMDAAGALEIACAPRHAAYCQPFIAPRARLRRGENGG